MLLKIGAMKALLAMTLSVVSVAAKGESGSEKTVAVESLKEISAAGQFKIKVTDRDPKSVVIRTESEVLACVHTRVSGSKLKLWIEESDCKGNADDADIQVELGRTALSEIQTSGAVSMEGKGLKSEKLLVETSGASKLNLGGDFGSLTIETSGATQIKLSGKVKEKLRVETSGASSIDARKVTAKGVILESSGAGKVDLGPSKELSLELSGMSRVSYVGKPTLKKSEISGLAQVSQRSE